MGRFPDTACTESVSGVAVDDGWMGKSIWCFPIFARAIFVKNISGMFNKPSQNRVLGWYLLAKVGFKSCSHCPDPFFQRANASFG